MSVVLKAKVLEVTSFENEEERDGTKVKVKSSETVTLGIFASLESGSESIGEARIATVSFGISNAEEFGKFTAGVEVAVSVGHAPEVNGVAVPVNPPPPPAE